MKIYTKTGDQGNTSLYTGERVAKDSLRVEAYGSIDETDAALGLARALCLKQEVKQAIYDMQRMLWQLMADVASLGEKGSRITAEHVQELEQMIDRFDAVLPPLTKFVIPGDTSGSAALHVARTVARRAERQMWRLAREESVNEHVLVALNRLSDLCFVLSRVESEEAKEA